MAVGTAIVLRLSDVLFWDGYFELPLKPVSKGDRRVQAISYHTAYTREMADWIFQNPTASESEAGFRSAERKDEQFIAKIECSGREDSLGVKKSYYQPPFIVVRTRYDDGSEIRNVLEIPIARGRRHATVQLP